MCVLSQMPMQLPQPVGICKIVLHSRGLRIKKNIIGIKKNYPQKPIPSSTIERTTFSTIARQFLSWQTQMLIPVRRSPGCYCTYVGLSALMCGCMHVRTCACMSVYYMSVCMSLVDVCMSMREGTNIKTPAEGLQTQDVAVRVKIVHRCAYSSAHDVPPPKAE